MTADSSFLNIEASSESTITLNTPKGSTTVELYSREGLELLSALWIKTAAEHRMMYEPKWLGLPVIQFPNDIIALQELIWRERPTKIIECGVAHGGSLIFYASLFELLGEGEVIGVEVALRDENRRGILSHSLAHRIHLVDGSSIEAATIDSVKSLIGESDRVMVFLDSNHSTAHVEAELDLYSKIIPVGGYIVVMDTCQQLVSDIPRGKPEWQHDNPWTAVQNFLVSHHQFEIDDYWTRLRISSNEKGFLRRVRQ